MTNIDLAISSEVSTDPPAAAARLQVSLSLRCESNRENP